MDKLITSENLSSSLKEKKKRLAGQLVVFNKKREGKNLQPVQCNPVRICTDMINENADTRVEKVELNESETKNLPRPFGIIDNTTNSNIPSTLLKKDLNAIAAFPSPKVSLGIISESRPILKAACPTFVPFMAAQRKTNPTSVSTEDASESEYKNFLKSLEDEDF